MSTVIILYGSRARGEIRPEADIDILAADAVGEIGSPREANGVSLHRYPQTWLLDEAAAGNLFVYHIAHEGIGLFDPQHFIQKLKTNTILKSSYEYERRVASAIIELLLQKDWKLDEFLRRRYFWAIRTIIISKMAESDVPRFSSIALEQFSHIEGLSNHIDNRSTESFLSCYKFGQSILDRFGYRLGLSEKLLRGWLGGRAGIAGDTLRLVETGEAVDVGSMIFYH